MPKAQQFMKRMYRPRDFYRLLTDMLVHIKDMRTAGKAGRVSKEFSERIMMAVTEVNGCRYCSYFHAQMALKSGMKKIEIERTLSGDFADAPQDEITALFFAQHYAEAEGRPNEEAVQCMIDNYGVLMVQDILAYIRAIMIGNAWGNMFDALRMRSSGKANGNTSFFEEISVVFGVALMIPIILIQLGFEKLTGKRNAAQYS